MLLTATARTFVGARRTNEDAFAIEDPLFLVADGMGDRGADASAIVVEVVVEAFRGDPKNPLLTFERALPAAAKAIDSRTEGARNAATMAALFVEESGATIAHVGDSRIYRLRRRRLERLTRDHSVLSEIEMRTGKRIDLRSTHPMGSVVTRGLGSGGDCRPDVSFVDLLRGDRFLLCTDGLTDALTENELRPLLARGGPDDAAQALIDAASEKGARDNVTLVVVDAR